MSRWSVWQMVGAASERVGAFDARGDALRVFRTTAKRRSAVFFGAEAHEESEDLSPRDAAAIERAVRAWDAAAAAPVTERAAGPEDFGGTDFPDDVADARALGVGAATEPPRGLSASAIASIRAQYAHDCALPDAQEAPLPVAFDAPVVEADVVEFLRVQLADATARAVAAEEATTRMQAVLDAARAATDALDTRAARIEAERDELAASLRERSAQLDAARAELAAKPHPVVRVAARTKPQRARAVETPVGTLFRVIRERARGGR